MPYIKIDPEACKGCAYCVIFCQKKMIERSDKLNAKGFRYMTAKRGKCSGCSSCVMMCPECAIILYE